MEKQTRFNLWYAIIAVLGVLWLRELWTTAQQVEPIPYSEFQQQLQAGRIKEIAIASNVIQGTYKDALPDGRTRFVTTRVDADLAKDLARYDVKFAGVIESTLLRDILSWVIPAVIFFAIWMYFSRRIAEQGGSAADSSLSARARRACTWKPTPK